jgi:hypothetical protein
LHAATGGISMSAMSRKGNTMRTTIFALAAGIALSFATVATADDASKPNATPVSATATSSEKLICHQFVHQGMLLKSNVCKTQKQWDEQRHQEEYDFADFQNRTYTHPFTK